MQVLEPYPKMRFQSPLGCGADMAFSCAVRKSDSKPVAWARQRSRSSFRSADTSRSRARASRSLSRSCSNIAIRVDSSVPGRSRTRSWCTAGSCSGPFLGNALASSEGSIENVPSSFLMALKRPDFIALLSVDLLFDVTFAAWDRVKNAMERPFCGAPFWPFHEERGTPSFCFFRRRQVRLHAVEKRL